MRGVARGDDLGGGMTREGDDWSPWGQHNHSYVNPIIYRGHSQTVLRSQVASLYTG